MAVRWSLVVITSVVAAPLLNADALRADQVKLDSGGSLNGAVTSGSKLVSVKTSSGALIVFERSDVKQVTRGRTATTAANSASTNAHSKSRAKRHKFTPEEEAWMPKVRGLVSRLSGDNRARAQQARTALLHIDATDAIPAISTYLGSSRNDEARHLYVVILHNMTGPKPVYYLVALSLYDPSPQIRSQARKAIREDQLDSARHLYIAALRSGTPHLARIAAIGLGEIGDPRGESVPDLINALVSYGTVARMNDRPANGVAYGVTVYSTPGLKMSDSTFNPSQAQLSTAPPADSTAATVNGSASSQSSSTSKDAEDGTSRPRAASATPQRSPRASSRPATVSDVYEEPIVPKTSCHQDRPLYGEIDHPEVLDALLKITDQPHPGFGFNRDRWRTWWTTEKANRDLQQPATPDRVVSSRSELR